MAKRPAEELLEDIASIHSPASKKARVEARPQTNGHSPSLKPVSANGHSFEEDARKGNDILAAADLEEEELLESAETVSIVADAQEDEQSAFSAPSRQDAPEEGYTDLYLDTINRAVLDFDFEKLCSVTLSNINVYTCLVCGKYYQGRGTKSHAYYHALEVGHHVYVNMQTKRVYVLPEGYEVKNKSLDDIKFVVDPRLSRDEVRKLDKEAEDVRDLSGKKYRPGFVGMNNIKANDYFNVVIQVLAHIPPLRNYFMLVDLSSTPELVQRTSILIRKTWNIRAFKSHVSPHELLQQISRQSSKQFSLLHQSDPCDFLTWFLNNLHLSLTKGNSKSKPSNSSIIHTQFRGHLKIESQQITAKASPDDRLRFEESTSVLVKTSPYLILPLDLPPKRLFKAELDKNIIPQIPLTSILSKYDGLQAQEHLNTRKRYRLLHPLPPYLFFHIKRFSENRFKGSEHNPTIVTFPVRSLDMAPYVEPNPALHKPGEPIWYDLCANVTLEAVKTRDDSVEGEVERRVWRCQVRDRARGDWLECQDLFVEGVATETLFTKEAYLMAWERRVEGKGRG